MSIWNQGAFDAAFSDKSPSGGGAKEPQGKLSQISLIVSGLLLVFYPFTIVGLIPFCFLYWISQKEKNGALGKRDYMAFIRIISIC